MSEMLVVAAVIGLIMAGLLSLLMTGQQTYLVGSQPHGSAADGAPRPLPHGERGTQRRL